MHAVVFLLYGFQSEALFMQASVGYRLDDSASDLFTGVAGRLTGKIICHTVNDYGSSENGIDEEPFVIKHLICIALIAQKRGKVSGMLRMGHVVGIVMISGLVKRYGTVPVFMNMHTIEIAGTLYMDIGKPEDFGFHQDSAVRGLIKFYRSCKLGLGSIPLDPCDSGRRRMGQEILKMRSRCRLIHGYLTNSFLSSICRKVPVSYSVTGSDGLIMAAAVSVPKFPFIHGFKLTADTEGMSGTAGSPEAAGRKISAGASMLMRRMALFFRNRDQILNTEGMETGGSRRKSKISHRIRNVFLGSRFSTGLRTKATDRIIRLPS